MGEPRKHAEIIKAWADGATIQYYNEAAGEWHDCLGNLPSWKETTQYRVKPTIMVLYGNVSNMIPAPSPTCRTRHEPNPVIWTLTKSGSDNLALTYENGVLVKAEVLKK